MFCVAFGSVLHVLRGHRVRAASRGGGRGEMRRSKGRAGEDRRKMKERGVAKAHAASTFRKETDKNLKSKNKGAEMWLAW